MTRTQKEKKTADAAKIAVTHMPKDAWVPTGSPEEDDDDDESGVICEALWMMLGGMLPSTIESHVSHV
jgi:hypothetical protein